MDDIVTVSELHLIHAKSGLARGIRSALIAQNHPLLDVLHLLVYSYSFKLSIIRHPAGFERKS